MSFRWSVWLLCLFITSFSSSNIILSYPLPILSTFFSISFERWQLRTRLFFYSTFIFCSTALFCDVLCLSYFLRAYQTVHFGYFVHYFLLKPKYILRIIQWTEIVLIFFRRSSFRPHQHRHSRMVLSKKIVYAKEMKGFPHEDNFRLEEEELDENGLQENQMLIKTICLRWVMR